MVNYNMVAQSQHCMGYFWHYYAVVLAAHFVVAHHYSDVVSHVDVTYEGFF